MPKGVQKIAKAIKRHFTRNNILNVLNDAPKCGFANLDGYDVVHFHSTLAMYEAKDLLKSYKGKVLLTSHSPKLFSREVVEDYTDEKDYKRYKDEYDKLVTIDDYSFNRADYIVFPCKEAEEPYYHTWKKYKTIHDKYKNKYIYIPTGIMPISTKCFSRKTIREKYNIPNDAFVVSYIGRHLPVKGYDQLKIIAEKVFQKNHKDIYFLIAGKEEPLTGLKDAHWIEAGWVDNPNELVFASDVFVLPNMETYFDLVLLQVMSVGKPVVLTNTGGNKFFRKYKNSGLLFYDYGDNDGAASILLRLRTADKQSLSNLGTANKMIFEKDFTVEKFTDKYIKAIQSLTKKSKK
jgi:glycosyltransferase involved in cell wall biosynthesis